MKIRVSIVMATHNGQLYLQEQLDSFVFQTVTPDELVIWDDASNDATKLIIEEFKKQAPFEIKTFWGNVNLGHCKAFSNALQSATGDLVFLSDQDDVWLPTKVETVMDYAKKNPDIVSFVHDATLVDENLKSYGITKFEQLKKLKLGSKWYVIGCCSTFRGHYLKSILPVPEFQISHDVWLNDIAEAMGEKLLLNEQLLLYRRHTKNVSPGILGTSDHRNRANKLTFYLKKLYSLNYDDVIKRIKNEIILEENACIILDKLSRTSNKKIARAASKLLIEKSDYVEFLKIRKSMLRKNRLLRIIPVFKNLLMGYYKNSNGLMSAIKDICT